MEKATFIIYRLQRQEYQKGFTWSIDEQGEDYCTATVTYTGKTTDLLYHDEQKLLGCNSIPEWRAQIIGQHIAEKGHTARGKHAYDIHREPITLLS